MALYTVSDITRAAEALWPAAGAEGWDAPGLVCGVADAPVGLLMLAVDAVMDTVEEAVAAEAGMLLVHHPLLMRGVTSISSDQYKGALLSRLIKADCALLSAHTNADIVDSGTSAVLGQRLGLHNTFPIEVGRDSDSGLGRVGSLVEPIALGRLARTLGEILPATAGGILVSGEFDRPITTVAVCAGAGDAFLGHPAVLAADVFITSDLRHHPASEARENARLNTGPALINLSHWASEWLWLSTAAEQLRDQLPGLTVLVSDLRTDPWDFAVLQ